MDAVITCDTIPWRTVGVPLIAQVVEFILKPVIEGEIVQLVGVPPLIVGVRVVIAESLAKMSCEELYTTELGAVVPPASTTEIYKEVVVAPALLLAVIVYTVGVCKVLGVPLNIQAGLKFNPLGIVGEIEHELGVPPVIVGVVFAIALSFSNIRGELLYIKEVGATKLFTTSIVMEVLVLPAELLAIIE